MTEKRFVLYEHKGADYILDTPNTELDFIEMLGDCLDEEEIVDLLNELDEKYVDEFSLRETLQQELQRVEEENEKLKKENKKQLTALKNLCEVEICEICEHQEYLTYETQDCIEYDSKCKKGFKEYNGKFYGIETLECDDFELRKELQRDD